MHDKILVFGNSGSGKTTLASAIADRAGLPRLELDLMAWDRPGVRRPFDDSLNEVMGFIDAYPGWVVEGCYGELVKEVAYYCTELIFLNPGIETCLQNNRARPWEPQKYDSEEAQNRYFEILLDWTREYDQRVDGTSLQYHRQFYEQFKGAKHEYRSMSEYVPGWR